MIRPKLFCLDDDRYIGEAIQRDLRDLFDVEIFVDFAALQKSISSQVAIVITDYHLGTHTGYEVLKWLKDNAPSCMRILMTGKIELNDVEAALHSHLLHKFILKPWERDLLRLHMLEALETHTLLGERDKFRELSITDPVTGLTNHRFFQEKFRFELQKAKNTKSPISLVMIDVDHFKILNDQFGHPKGDQILNQIGKTLAKNLRALDSISRYGGEEFAVVMPNTPSSTAFEIAENLRKAVLNMSSMDFRLSVSLGLAVYPHHGLDADEIISAADQALYCAKRQGRNMTIVGTDNSY